MTRWRDLTRGRPWVRSAVGLLALLSLLALATGQSTVLGGFSAAEGGNGTYQSGTVQLADSIGGVPCTSSPDVAGGITTNITDCPSYPLAQTIGSSSTTAPSSQGSIVPTSASLATTGSCGVQQFADTSGPAADTALAVNGATDQVPGPSQFTDGPKAVGFDGSTGWGETLAGPPTPFYASPGPQTFSVAGWFKTTTSGSIIGFTDAQSNTGQGNWDRHLWVDPAGHVVFGVYPNYVFEVSSAASTNTDYADGQWHFVVATVAPQSASTGTVLLYVDGALVAGTPGDEAINNSQPAQVYGGWWHLGWSNAANGWTDGPSNPYWAGSLADLAVFPSALSAGAVSSLAAQTTQSGTAATMAADGPQSFWSLQDRGSSLYTGPVANLAPGSTAYRDASGNPGTNTGSGQGTLGTDASGPLGDSATTFDGTSGWIQTATGPPTPFYASPGPQTFSVAGWFKTTTSGSIIGFSNAQSNTGQSNWDRHLWVDPAGHVVFGVYPNHVFEVSSAASTNTDYADGQWHFVVATAVPNSRRVGTVLLYVDGALVGGSARNEAINNSQPAQVYGGWWHLGWSNAANTWPDGPSNALWTGSLGQIVVFPTDLSAGQVSTLATEPDAPGYATAVTGGVAASNAYWPLDTASTWQPTMPCSYIGLTVQAGTGPGATCLSPAQAGACPAVSASDRPVVTSALPLSFPVLTFTTAVVGAVPATGVGLHVSVPWQITAAANGFGAALVHDQGYVLL